MNCKVRILSVLLFLANFSLASCVKEDFEVYYLAPIEVVTCANAIESDECEERDSCCWIVEEALDVDTCIGDVNVSFDLFTKNNKQYVAYYDKNRNMKIACRTIGSNIWDYQVLEDVIGYDSHNYVKIFVDGQNSIHVSGNMHASPLNYYYSQSPDIHSLIKQEKMVGSFESECTYPYFLSSNDGNVVFHYRFGASGNGNEVFNVFKNGKWERLFSALFDGYGYANSYVSGPIWNEASGFYHMVWCWRENSNCETNFSLCYARSRDLLTWENAEGHIVETPFKPMNKDVIVDDIPINGGLLNGTWKLGFDITGNPLIVYHKYDNNGYTQIFLAKFNTLSWFAYQLTNWQWRWDFKGSGSVPSEMQLYEPLVSDSIYVGYQRKDGTAKYMKFGLNSNTVSLMSKFDAYPEQMMRKLSSDPLFKVNSITERQYLDENFRYCLKWESINSSWDMKIDSNDKFSVLKLYKLRRKQP